MPLSVLLAANELATQEDRGLRIVCRSRPMVFGNVVPDHKLAIAR
jgi:hypothetical protein